MKITLVRHGKPKASSNPRVGAVGFAKWVRAYNHSFVDMDNHPPEHLRNRFDNYYTVSSDLNRALHSAELCLGKSADLVLTELREMDIPRFKLPFFMSVNSWLILSRLCWLIGMSSNCEPYKAGQKRVIAAVDLLVEQAQKTSDIAVFGHGYTNRIIAKELKRRGWTVQQQSKGFWGTTELSLDKAFSGRGRYPAFDRQLEKLIND